LETVLETKEVDEDIGDMKESLNSGDFITSNESFKKQQISGPDIEKSSVNTRQSDLIEAVIGNEMRHKKYSGDLSSKEEITTLCSKPNSSRKDSSMSIKAKIQGRYISKHIAPSLPELKKDKRSSIFSFWGTGDEGSKIKEKFSSGNECSTPFGIGVVKSTERIVTLLLLL